MNNKRLICLLSCICTFAFAESTIALLDQHLLQHGYTQIEAHMCSIHSDQPDFFKSILISHPSIHTIGEIGFNAGHSSVIFLETRPDIMVYSFDLMHHKYIPCAKEFIDQTFPNRHHLIGGNSISSVPLFYADHPSLQFDLIFIDGGHSYNIVLQDIQNMRKFAHKDTILVIDDAFVGMDPDKACNTCVDMNLIRKKEFYISSYDSKDWPRAWLVCEYVFDEI